MEQQSNLLSFLERFIPKKSQAQTLQKNINKYGHMALGQLNAQNLYFHKTEERFIEGVSHPYSFREVEITFNDGSIILIMYKYKKTESQFTFNGDVLISYQSTVLQREKRGL